MVTQILRVTEGHALAWSLWPGLALAEALVQAYLSPSQAPGMQGAMRSTFLPLEEIPERGKEVGGGRCLPDSCLCLFAQASHSGHSPVREKQVFIDGLTLASPPFH